MCEIRACVCSVDRSDSLYMEQERKKNDKREKMRNNTNCWLIQHIFPLLHILYTMRGMHTTSAHPYCIHTVVHSLWLNALKSILYRNTDDLNMTLEPHLSPPILVLLFRCHTNLIIHSLNDNIQLCMSSAGPMSLLLSSYRPPTDREEATASDQLCTKSGVALPLHFP